MAILVSFVSFVAISFLYIYTLSQCTQSIEEKLQKLQKTAIEVRRMANFTATLGYETYIKSQ